LNWLVDGLDGPFLVQGRWLVLGSIVWLNIVSFLVLSWLVPCIINGVVLLIVLHGFIFRLVDGLFLVTLRVGLADLSVDDIAPLDVGVAEESDPPVGFGVVVIAGLSLTVVDVILIVLHLPIHVVVKDMGLFFLYIIYTIFFKI